MTDRDSAEDRIHRAVRAVIDREQRRYEIARDVMAACAAYPVTTWVVPMAKAAVQCADALLAELERTDGE